MLGGFSLRWGTKNIIEKNTRLNKNWELFSILLLRAQDNITNEQIMEELWDEDEIENPVGALKNAVYTLRKMLKKYDDEVDFIILEAGNYRFNKAIPISVDVWEFEKLAKGFLDESLKFEDRMNMGRQALSLYLGDLLPFLMDRQWIMQYATFLRQLYLKIVTTASKLLLESRKKQDWEEVLNICNRAALLEPLHEETYFCSFEAMKRLDMKKAIMGYYPMLSNLFYDELGESLSPKLQEIYLWATEGSHKTRDDIRHIQQDLMEVTRDSRPFRGAYYCQYEMFKCMYQMMARSTEREGNSVNIMLVTLRTKSGQLPKKQEAIEEMANLKDIIKNALRKGDIFSRYSRNQYIVMLPMNGKENSSKVVERIIDTFESRHSDNKLVIDVEVQELTPVI